jgi:hypothetical protein
MEIAHVEIPTLVSLKLEALEFAHGSTRTSTLLCVAVNISIQQQYPSTLKVCQVSSEARICLVQFPDAAPPLSYFHLFQFTNFHITRLSVPRGWAWPLSSPQCRPRRIPHDSFICVLRLPPRNMAN